ncbi:ABC transporter substrate-binding protein [Hwanghaeella grinnelliae]|uniref:ABC transporter substrate-binding protein n=1 Tax=Hwanghaeella grinnelliae TaxID=2500179 RepID=A0A437QX35_9PROT|nr:ABC transporter substrate-binding protein [Hwanghaeella grinnelliae]RVU39095.1 ABC transporter substrate-binding protein [Hwanghaeella grinnelliae]
MKKSFISAALAATMMATPVLADSVKVGFVTTLTTPAAVIGNDMKNAAELAVEHMGGKMGNLDLEVIFEDDGFKPEIGKQKTEKLVKQDEVDFVTGFIWSHVLLASSRAALGADTFLISANAGPSQLAGNRCDKNFFSVSWQNDQTPMALGEVLNQNGVKSVYIMAPNYAAGKDMAAGVERTFKGEIKGKDLTKWGKDAQLDFSAELAKAKASGAEAIWVFYPGKAGGAFIKQFEQAGLADSMKLYTVFTVDALSLPRLQEGGLTGVLGSFATQTWSPDLDTPENKKFVSDFKAKYGTYPSFYGAQAYDAMFFIKQAVEKVGGNLTDKDALRKAMKETTYLPTRGNIKIGNNHFPISNLYLRETVADADGNWTTKIVSTVYDMHQDVYASECKM